MVGSTISHYRILEQVGAGGMGAVYKAEDTRLKRTVALKVLPPDLTRDPAARERFSREAQAASSLQHRNIYTVHDIDQTADGEMFIVMDFYQGQTLAARIAQGNLSLPEIRSIAVQIAEGLGEAHRHGLVHRDVKPANIMLTGKNEVKILDFGLAKLSCQDSMTLTGTALGTVAYMSPEQIRGDKIDQRTDIWSFGVLLFQMMTGTLPFKGEHPMSMIYSILNEEPRDLSLVSPTLPDDLASICRRCMQKDVSLRPSSMDEITDILTAAPVRRAQVTPFLRRTVRALRWPLLALLLPLAVFLVYLMLFTPPVSLSPADAIVVADFQNRTHEPFLDHSLTEAVKVSLRQSAQFVVLPQERIARALELLQVKGMATSDERTALAVARREGARIVVSGAIDRVGSTYILSGGIIDAGTGETVALLREDVPKVEACLGGIDRLCENLRKKLGESTAQISRAHGRLEDVTTSSLEALELFSRAVNYESQGKYQEAAIANEQAIAIDPRFVQAMSNLAYDHRKLGNDSLATIYHNRILPLISRVTDRERLEILSMYYGPSFEADIPKAYQYAQELTIRYPNDAYAFASLGHLAMSMGDARTALEANEKAVAIYPEYAKTCYNNSAYALALAGREEEALRWFRKAKELRPDYATIDTYMALAQWAGGNLDSAEALLYAPVASADPAQRIQRFVVTAALCYFQGRLSAAQDAATGGVAECRQHNRPADEAYLHYILAEIHAAGGNMTGYKKEMSAAIRLAASPYFDLVFAGRSYARHGMSRNAEEMLKRISVARSYDPVFVKRRTAFIALLSGEVALANGRPEQAQRYFEAVKHFRAGDPIYFLAKEGAAEVRAKRGDKSMIALFGDILSHRGEITMGYISPVRQTGPWTRQLWPEAYLRSAEGHMQFQQGERASQCLDSTMSCWRRADASDLLASKARMMRLRLNREH